MVLPSRAVLPTNSNALIVIWSGLCCFLSPMTGNNRQKGAALKEEDLQSLLTQALFFANERVNCFRWRGSLGGVLPDGYDAEAIASEAVSELLHQPPRRRHASKIRRLVWKQIDHLHRRKEPDQSFRLFPGDEDVSAACFFTVTHNADVVGSSTIIKS